MGEFKIFGVFIFLFQYIILCHMHPVVLENHLKMLYNDTKQPYIDNPIRKADVGLLKSPKQDEDGGDDGGNLVSSIAETLSGVANNLFTDNVKFGNALAESANILPGDAGETVSGFLNSVAEPINQVVGNPFQQFQEYLDQNFPITTPKPITPKPKVKATTKAPATTRKPGPGVSHIYFVHKPPTGTGSKPSQTIIKPKPAAPNKGSSLSLAASISSLPINANNGQGGFKRPTLPPPKQESTPAPTSSSIVNLSKEMSANSQMVVQIGNSNLPPISNPGGGAAIPPVSNTPVGTSSLQGNSNENSIPISNSKTPTLSDVQGISNAPTRTNPPTNPITPVRNTPAFANPPVNSNSSPINPSLLSNPPVNSKNPSSNRPTFANPPVSSNSPTINTPTFVNPPVNSNTPTLGNIQENSNIPAIYNTLTNSNSPSFSGVTNLDVNSNPPSFSINPEESQRPENQPSVSKFSQLLLNSNKPTVSPLNNPKVQADANKQPFSELLLASKNPILGLNPNEQKLNNEVNLNELTNTNPNTQVSPIFNSVSNEAERTPNNGVPQSLKAVSAIMLMHHNEIMSSAANQVQNVQNSVSVQNPNISVNWQNQNPNNIQGNPLTNNFSPDGINQSNNGFPQNYNGTANFNPNNIARPTPEDEDDDEDGEDEDGNHRVD